MHYAYAQCVYHLVRSSHTYLWSKQIEEDIQVSVWHDAHMQALHYVMCYQEHASVTWSSCFWKPDRGVN